MLDTESETLPETQLQAVGSMVPKGEAKMGATCTHSEQGHTWDLWSLAVSLV